ncbi:MAG: hypothetical protein AB7O81_33090 [Blastocatellales bacterium]
MRKAEEADLDFIWRLRAVTMKESITQSYGWDERQALEAGKPLTLQVLRNNPAVSLYKRHGFKVFAQNGPYKLLMRWDSDPALQPTKT